MTNTQKTQDKQQKTNEQIRNLIVDLIRLDTQITKAANFERSYTTLSKRYDAKAKKIAKLLNVDEEKFIEDLNL